MMGHPDHEQWLNEWHASLDEIEEIVRWFEDYRDCSKP